MNIDTLHHLEKLRRLLQPYPSTEEYTCFGTPAFRIKKKLICRIREDGETLAVHCDDREPWMKKTPKVFFITDHYLNYRFVLVKLSAVCDKDLEKVLHEAWMQVAPKRMIKEYEESLSNKE